MHAPQGPLLASRAAHRPALANRSLPWAAPWLPCSFVVLQRKDPEAAARLADEAQQHITLRHERLQVRMRIRAWQCSGSATRVAPWPSSSAVTARSLCCITLRPILA